MKKITQAILDRDAKRDIGAELLQAVRDIKAGKGKHYTLDFAPVTIARHRLKMSQTEFAELLGVSVRTLQDWEQRRREPSGAARALIKVAQMSPGVVRKALRAA